MQPGQSGTPYPQPSDTGQPAAGPYPPPYPAPHPAYFPPPPTTKFGKLAWAGLILGIVGVVGSIIPFLNNLTAVGAIVGLILAVIGMFGTRKIVSGIGIVVCVLAVVFTIVAQVAFSSAVDDAFKRSDPQVLTTTQPASRPDQTAPGAIENQQPPAAPTRAAPAAIGGSITLLGNSDGEQARVTAVKIVDPAPPKDEYSRPEQGNRFVAVQFRIENIGSLAYDDSPSNGAQLIDGQGQQFQATFLGTAAGPEFAGGVKIAPGASALGFVTFEVPKTSKAAKVQFTLDSGFADQTGEWTIR
jgi:hypothetical protein